MLLTLFQYWRISYNSENTRIALHKRENNFITLNKTPADDVLLITLFNYFWKLTTKVGM